jgi:hypothetical protein
MKKQMSAYKLVQIIHMQITLLISAFMFVQNIQPTMLIPKVIHAYLFALQIFIPISKLDHVCRSAPTILYIDKNQVQVAYVIATMIKILMLIILPECVPQNVLKTLMLTQLLEYVFQNALINLQCSHWMENKHALRLVQGNYLVIIQQDLVLINVHPILYHFFKTIYVFFFAQSGSLHTFRLLIA